MDIARIHEEATEAAKNAAQAMYDSIGGDRLMCGFAWVKVYGIKLSSKEGKEFAKLGFKKGYEKGAGIQLWNPSGSRVQNIDIKEAGAQAYAEVFSKYGYKAYPASRLD